MTGKYLYDKGDCWRSYIN